MRRLQSRMPAHQGEIIWHGLHRGGALKINQPSSVATGFIPFDPQLARSDGIYRPASSSSAINIAVGDYATDDLGGQPRNKPDIGSDEFSSNAFRRRQLTLRDVGPSWMKLSAML